MPNMEGFFQDIDGNKVFPLTTSDRVMMKKDGSQTLEQWATLNESLANSIAGNPFESFYDYPGYKFEMIRSVNPIKQTMKNSTTGALYAEQTVTDITDGVSEEVKIYNKDGTVTTTTITSKTIANIFTTTISKTTI